MRKKGFHMVAGSSLLEFIVKLVSIPQAQQDFHKHPGEVLRQHGFSGLCAQDVHDALPLVANTTRGFAPRPVDGGCDTVHPKPPTCEQLPGENHLDAVIRQLRWVSTNYSCTDTHAPAWDGPGGHDIWAPKHGDHDRRLVDHDLRHGDHDRRPIDHDPRHGDHDPRPGDHDLRHGDHDRRPIDHDPRHGDHDPRPGDHDLRHGDHDRRPIDHDPRHGDHDPRPVHPIVATSDNCAPNHGATHFGSGQGNGGHLAGGGVQHGGAPWSPGFGQGHAPTVNHGTPAHIPAQPAPSTPPAHGPAPTPAPTHVPVASHSPIESHDLNTEQHGLLNTDHTVQVADHGPDLLHGLHI
jgi:hypothetical protein